MEIHSRLLKSRNMDLQHAGQRVGKEAENVPVETTEEEMAMIIGPGGGNGHGQAVAEAREEKAGPAQPGVAPDALWHPGVSPKPCLEVGVRIPRPAFELCRKDGSNMRGTAFLTWQSQLRLLRRIPMASQGMHRTTWRPPCSTWTPPPE